MIDSPQARRRPLARERLRGAVPTILAVAAVSVCIVAGNWQRDRMQQKDAAAKQYLAASAAPPMGLPDAVTDWAPWRYRQVDVEGRYDAARQILIDNRVHLGRFGYHVVTPLRTADGRAVLVNRGFVPAGPTRDALPSAVPPPGDVRVRGRINLPAARYIELASTAPDRGVWQNLDPTRFAAVSGLAVLPVIVEQLDGAPDGLSREWLAPDTASGKHLGYMLQWYAFAAIAAGLWAFFTFRRMRIA